MSNTFVIKSVSIFKLILKLFVAILFVPLIFWMRLLRPFVLIRFGTLWSSRIGHYAGNTEMYLCERDAGLQPKSIDFFFNEKIICNCQMKKMWERTLRILPIPHLQTPLYLANRLLPGYKKHVITLPSDKDLHGLLGRIPPHISLTLEEEQKGYDALIKMGIPAESKFVCFLVRDASYLNTVYPNNDWSYLDFRNSNIDKYIPMLEELARRDYYVLRMGAKQNRPLNIKNHKIIDYSKRFRTEFLDIYLSAKCNFFISNGAGLDAVPLIFRRPIVFVNYVPYDFANSWGTGDIFIPKKLWLSKECRFLTISEIFTSGISKLYGTDKYAKMGIELIENTSEEITSVVLEMEERLKGTFYSSEEDEELQQRFRSIVMSSGFRGTINTRIGSDFLRQNKDLLE